MKEIRTSEIEFDGFDERISSTCFGLRFVRNTSNPIMVKHPIVCTTLDEDDVLEIPIFI